MSRDREAPLQEHVIELLERLRRILIAIIVSSATLSLIPDPRMLGSSFVYRPLIFSLIDSIRRDVVDVNNPVIKPLASLMGIKSIEIELIAYSWIDSIEVLFMLSFLLGITVSSPYIAKQIYDFLEPALLEKEKRILLPFVLGFTALFISGVIYGYKVVLPLTMFFLSLIYIMSGIELVFSLQQFFNFIIIGALIVGLFFTFPLMVAVASYLDMITPSSIRGGWRYAFLLTIIVTAIITPDPTPISMLALSVPFLLLYWLSYLLAKRFHR